MNRHTILCTLAASLLLVTPSGFAQEVEEPIEAPAGPIEITTDDQVEDIGALLLEGLERSLRSEESSAGPVEASQATENATPAKDGSDVAAKPPVDRAAEAGPPWLDDLAAGRRQAQLQDKPLLVRLTATWCGPCRLLARELAKPEVTEELEQLVLVLVDIDDSPEIARDMSVQGIPALRLFSPAGKPVAAIDGLRPAAELQTWLQENRAAARQTTPSLLVAEGVPGKGDLDELLQFLASRDPAVREAAIQRLVNYPVETRLATASAFVEGSLAVRLAALEVLRSWDAPLTDLDPWRPETMTAERLAKLETWASQTDSKTTTPPDQDEEKLEGPRLAAAQAEIAALLAADESEVSAHIVRLARYGAPLVEPIARLAAEATTDQDQQRLTTVRYHLVASRRLTLEWPEGLSALASTDLSVRRKAVDQLAAMSEASNRELLLELFSDSDSVVREIALRGLRDLGGAATTAALARLLKDPEPNVRAAVLKQLTETPQPALVPQIIEYVGEETNQDLLVHAVRVLKQAAGKGATEALITLAEHSSWQVRAAVAEALGELAESRGNRFGFGNPAQSAADKSDEVAVALGKLLDDEDGFVVSRALKSVQQVGSAPSDKLAIIIERHPALAKEAIETMVQGGGIQDTEQLVALSKNENPQTRAAAIMGLRHAGTVAAENGMSPFARVVLASLADSESSVRIAAARELVAHYDKLRPEEGAEEGDPVYPSAQYLEIEEEPSLIGRAAKSIFNLLGGHSEPPLEAPALPPTESAEGADHEPADGLENAAEAAPGEDLPDHPPELSVEAGPTSQVPAISRDDPFGAAIGVADASTVVNVEAWLKDFRAGKARPAWLNQTAPRLLEMLEAESSEERMWAALALLPLGAHDKPALAALLDTVKNHSTLAAQTHVALPWLEWEQRGLLFDQLLEVSENPTDLYSLTQKLVELKNPQAAERLWKILANENIEPTAAAMVIQSLRENYFGDEWYGASNAPKVSKESAKTDALRHVGDGSYWQKTTALVLLASIATDEAAKHAEKIYRDPASDGQLRATALQILLVTADEATLAPTAVEALGEHDAALQKTALTFLAHGKQALQQLHESIYLPGAHTYSFSSGDATIIIPKAPAGLDKAVLRKIVQSDDKVSAAYAAYFLTLLDETTLTPLIDHWRVVGQDERVYRGGSWSKLVYRAVAYTDAADQLPTLRSIYDNLKKNEGDLKDFYWTIRIMSGPEVLQLRKEIREAVGMEQLR